jgi:hypothetical protein
MWQQFRYKVVVDESQQYGLHWIIDDVFGFEYPLNKSHVSFCPLLLFLSNKSVDI